MDRYERILALHRHLKMARYPVSLARLMDELGCSRATLYRDLAFLRDALGAPVESDSTGDGGFRYDESEAERFELPGLWLNSDELHALLATHQLLDRTGNGVLASALAPGLRLSRAFDQRAHAPQRVAAAADALQGQLVPRRLRPRARRSAQLFR